MKRRRVFRALIGYGIVSFAVLQVIEPVMHGLQLPDWVLSATVVALGIGFAFTLVLAWALDVKGGRIERTGPAPSGRLLVVLVVVGLALGAPGVGWYFWKTHRAAVRAEAASIAVLPFKDLSPAKDQDWMCDGIAEEIWGHNTQPSMPDELAWGIAYCVPGSPDLVARFDSDVRKSVSDGTNGRRRPTKRCGCRGARSPAPMRRPSPWPGANEAAPRAVRRDRTAA